MVDKIGSRICCGNTAYKRSKSDFYPTPPEATQALLNFLRLPKGTKVWECASGEDHMVKVMEQNGLEVIGTDIAKGVDFLQAEIPDDVHWIITNPPFSLADEFVRKAASHEVPFAMLLKSQYWHAAKRINLFLDVTPAYVLPLTWRPDFLMGSRGGAPLMECIWCVWLPGVHITQYMPLMKPK